MKKFSAIFISLAVLTVAFFLLSHQKKVSMVSNAEIKSAEDAAVTFLVLGKMGKVVGWNNAPDLADAIVVMDYRPKIGVVNMVSLPRDLYLDLGGESVKLNEVTKRNKIAELLEKLPQITGLGTREFIVVNIDVLKGIVDALDGIDIDLKEQAVDKVSGFVMPAGQRHLNGDDVVWLVRNRFSPEGDFFREKNQHEVIQSIVDKYKKLNSIEKATFMFKMAPEITKLQTNVNFQKLLPLFEKIGNIRFNDVVLDFKTNLVVSSSTQMGTSSAYILLPRLGEDDYREIRGFIESKLEK